MATLLACAAVGLASTFAAGRALAAGGVQEVQERAGALLGGMKEAGQRYRDLKFKRGGMGAEARAASARKTAQVVCVDVGGGRPHRLTYRLQRRDGAGWRIIDIDYGQGDTLLELMRKDMRP